MPATERRSPTRGLTRPLVVLATLASIAALHFAQEVLLPLVLALLLVFLLSPLVNQLERRGFGRVPAVLSLVLLTFMLVAGLAYVVVGQVLDLAARLPEYRGNLRAKVAALRLPSEGTLGRATATIRGLRDEILRDDAAPRPARPPRRLLPADGSAPPPLPADPAAAAPTPAPAPKPIPVEIVRSTGDELRDIATTTLLPVLAPLGKAALVFVFVVFMLLRKEDLRDRFIHLGGQGRLTVTTRALEEASGKVGSYLLMQLIINASFGVLIGIGLTFVGLPNAFLWGLLAGILRFIPYVGTWLGAVPPMLLALAVSPSWATPFVTAGVFLLVDLLVVNVLEPWLYGSSTGLSPVAIMVAATFWTWLWGTAGLLLSTPLTVCLVVLGRHVPSLGFLDTLLGSKPDLPVADRYYQRLLSRDATEAAYIAADYEKKNGRPQMLSDLLVPAVVAAKADFQRGEVPAETWQFLTKAVRSHACRGAEEEDPASAARPPDVLVLPTNDDGDEVIGVILCEMLWPQVRADCIPARRLANEKAIIARDSGAQAVCISDASRQDDAQARYLAKRLRNVEGGGAMEGAKFVLVAGMWGTNPQDETPLSDQAARIGADQAVRDLLAARDALRGWVMNPTGPGVAPAALASPAAAAPPALQPA